MRYTLISCFIIIISAAVSAQTEYVPADNQVYELLTRMETLGIINNYNSFEIPKTRKEIAGYLNEIINSESRLDNSDQVLMNDLKIEFEYELYGTLNNSTRLIGNENYNFLSQKEKYLYFYNEPEKFNLFINLTGEGDLLLKDNLESEDRNSAFLGIAGGEIRGTVLNKFGFYIKGTNGNVFGKKNAALLKPDLRYNYKLNDNSSETFFDETQGYLTADFDLIKFKYGRDRMNIGYGIDKIILGNNAPVFDYLALSMKYKFFSFSFFHGQLLGHESYAVDTVTGGVNVVDSKYMAYHRIGFNISRDFNFGAGELIIYGQRSVDLSYLNPFGFYKSIEHSNRDRDNAMLFFDANNKTFDGLKLYATLLIDDIKFGKLGTGWWGNQTIVDAGINSELFYNILPLDINLQYTRIDPYVFTHRLIRNNYTNFGYSLSSISEPNSELFLSEINYRFSNRLKFSFIYNFRIHGANRVDTNGKVKENVGGDISLGHRIFDSEYVRFLDGFKEYSRMYSIKVIYEPINEYFLSVNFNYLNESLQLTKNEEFDTILIISVKF